MFIPALREWNRTNFWVQEKFIYLFISNFLQVMLIFYFVAIIGLIPLYCCMRVFPVNMILLVTWTTIFGWAIGMICSIYNITTVLVAMGITTVTVVLLTAYVLISRAKLHWMGLFLGMAMFVFSMTVMWTLVFSLFWRIAPWWHMVISGFGAFLFCLFILYGNCNTCSL